MYLQSRRRELSDSTIAAHRRRLQLFVDLCEEQDIKILPESVDPIAADRTATVDGLRSLLGTPPEPITHRLASCVRTQIRIADENPSGTDVSDS